MKRHSFLEEQIIEILKKHEASLRWPSYVASTIFVASVLRFSI